MTILAVYRTPFGLAPAQVAHLPAGLTLEEMAARMDLPADFGEMGTIRINGHPAPRPMWRAIRPRAIEGRAIEVTFFAEAPRGGDGGKNTLTAVAAIALTVGTYGVAGGWLASAGLGSAFAAGSVGANLAAAGLSLVGSLALQSLAPPPTLDSGSTNTESLGSSSASGNELTPNGQIPRVVGTRRISPPLCAEPYVYFSQNVEVAEAVYVLAGPHQVEGIRVNGVEIADNDAYEVEVLEGFDSEPALTLVQQTTRSEAVQAELQGHQMGGSSEDDIFLLDTDVDDPLPQPQVVATRRRPDEHLLQLTFPNGISRNAGPKFMIVPLRLRIRAVNSSTWINLPQLHVRGSGISGMRLTIRLKWGTASASIGGSGDGFTEARIGAPGQTVSPVGAAWAAHESFSTGGSGNDYMNRTAAADAAASRITNVQLGSTVANIFLNETDFPKGKYEVEILRGYGFENANYDAATYQFRDAVRDFFAYQDDADGDEIAQDQAGVNDQVYLVRSVSLWNENPVQTQDCAVVAIRARNAPITNVSVLASGYASIPDGAGGYDWGVTSEPHHHLRDVLAGFAASGGGALAAKPLEAALLDSAEMTAWGAHCVAQGYQVNAVLDGTSVAEACKIIGGAGYAQLRMSDTWGVMWDRDRTGEAPVQVFSPHNSSGMSWSKTFADLPDAFRVTFDDAEDDYETRQMMVYRDGATGDLVEQVTYEAFVTEAEVEARAAYDFATALQRGVFYTLTAPAEAIRCKRGSLVGVQHDMLTEHMGSARLAGAMLNGDDQVTHLFLETPVTIFSPDYTGEIDGEAASAPATGVALRRKNGTITLHEVANASGEATEIALTEPADGTGLEEGVLAVFGPLESVLDRMIVFGITPRADMSFDLTLVDEAPAIWSA